MIIAVEDETDVRELVAGDTYYRDRLITRNKTMDEEDYTEKHKDTTAFQHFNSKTLGNGTKMEKIVTYKDFMETDNKYIDILEPGIDFKDKMAPNEQYMDMGLNVRRREGDINGFYENQLDEVTRKESLIQPDNYLGEVRVHTDKVGKSGDDEYNVPNPVYPTFTKSGVLTKSDIITMYCRER